VSFVVEELKAVFDPRGGQWLGGKYVPSLLAAIGEVIERHMIDIGFLASQRGDGGRPAPALFVSAGASTAAVPAPEPESTPRAHLRQCPKCANLSLIRQEGCDTCTNCDYSKCG
jgi:ribonucleoside-diphosphate reductase alpha chain